MRDVLDPKRFYKKENSKPQIPEFSQVGTIIEGPTEYFSGRLSNKERKRTLVEEILVWGEGDWPFQIKVPADSRSKDKRQEGALQKDEGHEKKEWVQRLMIFRISMLDRRYQCHLYLFDASTSTILTISAWYIVSRHRALGMEHTFIS